LSVKQCKEISKYLLVDIKTMEIKFADISIRRRFAALDTLEFLIYTS